MAHVLVVDDDVDFADGLADILRVHSHEVTTVYSGEQAIAAVEGLRDQLDLVITDVKLGSRTGATLVGLIRAIVDIPVILITAYASTDTAIESLRNNAYDYLLKPCNPDDILRVVNGALEISGERKVTKKLVRDMLDELLEIRGTRI